MAPLIDSLPYPLVWLIGVIVIYGRYLLMAGVAYGIFYHWNKQGRWTKIQAAWPNKSRSRAELLESLSTAMVFALVGLFIAILSKYGYTQIYHDPGAYGIIYIPFSFLLLVMVHDSYFYWLHYFMHRWPSLRKIHATHHRSYNPSPLTALAFHPTEALLEIAIIPLVVCLLPIHPGVIIFFAFFSLTWNIIGHLGYELFPVGWLTHPLGQYLNTSTHHNLHHLDGRYNFGLYFNWWDRICGTNHPNYHRYYKRLNSRDDMIEGHPQKNKKE